MHYVEHILPEIVIFRDMVEEASTVFVELLPVQITDVAEVVLVVLNLLLLFSQLSKCIDDDTEQNIQQNDLHKDVEARIMEELDIVLVKGVCVVDRFRVVPNATTKEQALVEHCSVALEHGLAEVLSYPV